MAPKAARGNNKRARTEQGSSSSAPPPPPAYTINRGAPPVWPRDEHTMFQVEFESAKKTLKSVLMSDEVDKREGLPQWDDFDSLLYNEWLKVPLATTRFVHEFSLSCLEIKGEVMTLVDGMGLTKLVTGYSDMFPDLVRQFFATVKLYNNAVTDEEKRDPSNYVMSFMANGTRYLMTAKAICRAFDFPIAKNAPVTGLPSDIDEGVATLWSRIGTGVYNAGISAQADVRHPAIRYLLRLISTTILCKMEPVKVRNHELVMLSYALRNIVHNGIWDTRTPNMGIVLMEYLHSLRHTPLTVTNFGKKKLTVGSILTPIFEKCKVVMQGYTVERTPAFVDMEHMKNAHWVQTAHPLRWVFPIALGQPRMVEIRRIIDLMPVTQDASLLFFEPAAELLKELESSRKYITRGASTSQATTPQAPPQPQQHQHVFPSVPQGPLTEEQRFEWLTRALKATWDAMSCKSSCVRPRTPSPPPRQPSPAASSEHHSAEEED